MYTEIVVASGVTRDHPKMFHPHYFPLPLDNFMIIKNINSAILRYIMLHRTHLDEHFWPPLVQNNKILISNRLTT